MKSLRIEWEKNYGIDQRTGWSITINGHCVVGLRKWLIVAIAEGLWKVCPLRILYVKWRFDRQLKATLRRLKNSNKNL